MIAALVRPERCAKVPAASGPNRSERTVVRSLLSCAAVRDSRSVCMYRARRRIAMGAHSDAGLEGPASTSKAADTSSAALLRRAREEFENRRRRSPVFGRDMFGEPAWDMLLVLYLQDASGPRETVGSLIKYSGTSASS